MFAPVSSKAVFKIRSTVTEREREKKMFYLTTHSTHFIYGYMASDIRLMTILIVRKETRYRHIGYSYRLTARVLLYAPSHRQDSTYHGLRYTSRGALAGTSTVTSQKLPNVWHATAETPRLPSSVRGGLTGGRTEIDPCQWATGTFSTISNVDYLLTVMCWMIVK